MLHSSMKLSVSAASPANEAGLTNPGYYGFGLRAANASIWARQIKLNSG
jgi:hypothetical protein